MHQDYDRLDRAANSKGYHTIECFEDERIDTPFNAGAQNANLHCGWIATMGDSTHSVDEMVELLRRKMRLCIERGEKIKVGFCQTGWFSIGYTIYVKREEARRVKSGNLPSQMPNGSLTSPK